MNATALGAGHCGVTESVQGNSCDTDARSGSFGASIHGMNLRTLSDCAAACLRWCSRCNYVSFSPAKTGRGSRPADCSWYVECPSPLERSFMSHGFVSLKVRATPPPPPPPPAHLPLADSVNGYCEIMGGTDGDCEADDQGGFDARDPGDCLRRCRDCTRCSFISYQLRRPYDNHTRGHSTRHPPHWWSCRWYAYCDLGFLRRSPPRLGAGYATRQVREPPPQRGGAGHGAPKIGIVTLVEVQHSTQDWGLICSLVQWCENAKRVQDVLSPEYDVGLRILTAVTNPERVLPRDQRDACSGARLAPVPRSLVQTLRTCKRPDRWYERMGFLLHKFAAVLMTEFAAVLFADVDLELLPLAEYDRGTARAAFLQGISQFLSDRRVSVVAGGDQSSPVNSGCLLLRPSRTLYLRGLRWLGHSRCAFNDTHGWRQTRAAGAIPLRRLGSDAVHWSRRQLTDWRFVGADSDQGFVVAFFFIVSRLGAEPLGSGTRYRHWFGGGKPHSDAALRPGLSNDDVADLIKQRDIGTLVKLYDFTLHLHGTRALAAPGAGAATPLVTMRTCAAAQSSVLRSIEADVRFGDVADEWARSSAVWGVARWWQSPF